MAARTYYKDQPPDEATRQMLEARGDTIELIDRPGSPAATQFGGSGTIGGGTQQFGFTTPATAPAWGSTQAQDEARNQQQAAAYSQMMQGLGVDNSMTPDGKAYANPESMARFATSQQHRQQALNQDNTLNPAQRQFALNAPFAFNTATNTPAPYTPDAYSRQMASLAGPASIPSNFGRNAGGPASSFPGYDPATGIPRNPGGGGGLPQGGGTAQTGVQQQGGGPTNNRIPRGSESLGRTSVGYANPALARYQPSPYQTPNYSGGGMASSRGYERPTYQNLFASRYGSPPSGGGAVTATEGGRFGWGGSDPDSGYGNAVMSSAGDYGDGGGYGDGGFYGGGTFGGAQRENPGRQGGGYDRPPFVQSPDTPPEWYPTPGDGLPEGPIPRVQWEDEYRPPYLGGGNQDPNDPTPPPAWEPGPGDPPPPATNNRPPVTQPRPGGYPNQFSPGSFYPRGGTFTPNPYDPRSNYNPSMDAGDMTANDRLLAFMGGQNLENYLQDYGNYQIGRASDYENAALNAYGGIASGGGGYSPDEMEQILREGDLENLQQSPEEYWANYLNDAEQSGIIGAPNEVMRRVQDNVNQFEALAGDRQDRTYEALRGQDANTRDAQTGLEGGVRGALGSGESSAMGYVDPSKLGLSGEFLQNYNFSPYDQQGVIDEAAADVQAGTQAQVDETRRRARAQGLSPMQEQAMVNRLMTSGAVNRNDAMLRARNAARQMALDTTRQRESMRLGAEGNIAGLGTNTALTLGGRRVAAEGDIGSSRLANERYLGGQRLGAYTNLSDALMGGYGRLGEQAVGSQQWTDTAGSQRAGDIASRRLAAERTNQDARYGRGMSRYGALSGGYRDAATQRRGDEAEYRNFLANSQNAAQQAGQVNTQQRVGAYGQQMGAMGGATGHRVSLEAVPALRLSKGGVLDQDPDLSLGAPNVDPYEGMDDTNSFPQGAPGGQYGKRPDNPMWRKIMEGGLAAAPMIGGAGAGGGSGSSGVLSGVASIVGKVLPFFLEEGGVVEGPRPVMVGEGGDPEVIIDLERFNPYSDETGEFGMSPDGMMMEETIITRKPFKDSPMFKSMRNVEASAGKKSGEKFGIEDGDGWREILSERYGIPIPLDDEASSEELGNGMTLVDGAQIHVLGNKPTAVVPLNNKKGNKVTWRDIPRLKAQLAG